MVDIVEVLQQEHAKFCSFTSRNPKLLIEVIVAAWTEGKSSTPSELAFDTSHLIIRHRASQSSCYEDLAHDVCAVLDLLFASTEGNLRKRIILGFAFWVTNQ